MTLPAIRPQPLVRIPEPFDDPAWLWELKLDGFRALAYIDKGECRLFSRNGHIFRRFDALRPALPREVAAKSAILDGEVVCLDDEGRSLFTPLLFGRGRPVFAAFDVLWEGRRDLRQLHQIERKARLRALLPNESPHVLYVEHVVGKGKELLALACDSDLEGVVGKWIPGTYQSGGRTTSWVKVKNANYSQAEGRPEFFEKRSRAKRARPPELKLT